MIIEHNITKDDYMHFVLYHYQHSATLLKGRFGLQLLVPLVLLLVAFYFRNIGVWFYIILAIAIIASVLWIKYLKNIFRYILSLKLESMYKKGDFDPYIGKWTLIVGDEKLERKGADPALNSEVNYDDIEMIVYSDSAFFLYIDSNNALAVPFSAFKDENQKDEFLEYLKEKTGL